jgi:hypothetical protein
MGAGPYPGSTAAAPVPAYSRSVPLHPAENRGYRELYLTGRQLAHRWGRLADSLAGTAAEKPLRGGAEGAGEMLAELGPLTARHDLHGRLAAQGSGASFATFRGTVADRFLERNQALRVALHDMEHVVDLLPYLANVSERRGDSDLAEFCRRWEGRLRRRLTAARKAAAEMGTDPDGAIEPLDGSPLGRAAHGTSWLVGTFGEWFDRQLARIKR